MAPWGGLVYSNFFTASVLGLTSLSMAAGFYPTISPWRPAIALTGAVWLVYTAHRLLAALNLQPHLWKPRHSWLVHRPFFIVFTAFIWATSLIWALAQAHELVLWWVIGFAAIASLYSWVRSGPKLNVSGHFLLKSAFVSLVAAAACALAAPVYYGLSLAAFPYSSVAAWWLVAWALTLPFDVNDLKQSKLAALCVLLLVGLALNLAAHWWPIFGLLGMVPLLFKKLGGTHTVALTLWCEGALGALAVCRLFAMA